MSKPKTNRLPVNLVAFAAHKAEMGRMLEKAIRVKAWGEANYLKAYLKGMGRSKLS